MEPNLPGVSGQLDALCAEFPFLQPVALTDLAGWAVAGESASSLAVEVVVYDDTLTPGLLAMRNYASTAAFFADPANATHSPSLVWLLRMRHGHVCLAKEAGVSSAPIATCLRNVLRTLSFDDSDAMVAEDACVPRHTPATGAGITFSTLPADGSLACMDQVGDADADEDLEWDVCARVQYRGDSCMDDGDDSMDI